MELCSPDALGDNDAAIGRAIIGGCGDTLLILGLDVVGMGEIEIGILWNTGKDRQSRTYWCYLIPAHMRNFRSMRNTTDLATEEAQAVHLTFGVMVCKQLHAKADTEKRLALLCCLANSIIQPTL